VANQVFLDMRALRKCGDVVEWIGVDMFISKYRGSSYEGLPAGAWGLHEKAFALFRKYVSPGARVLDLGSGSGAWAKRLYDASYDVTACDFNPTPTSPMGSKMPNEQFPYHQVDLNQNFSERLGNGGFDAMSIMEVIEHLENPRHTFRQIKSLLKKGGVVILTTPNASGLYSRLRFFFTGQMAMFTDRAYGIRRVSDGSFCRPVRGSHITPLTAWQLEKVFSESDLKVLERRFHDTPFFPPRSLGDLAKITAWLVFRMFMFGTVGGQIILYILRDDK
jgi:2-polyprenyl-3-methyl-5-hydroxy-6-metoxy-1,4-benzoquinol methylase